MNRAPFPPASSCGRPQNVGIHGVEVYFPRTAVRQEELEEAAGVSPGKFTIGLGQQNMAYVSELEDINSILMTATQSLLEKYNVPASAIGRLEVGTETLIDKSKSAKSCIVQLLTDHGNFDLEGVDSINACYGGTAALLNSVAWCESSAFDGRYALVVCGDIAVYEPGPARPTGGCAAVAMLIGPDAPIHLSTPSIRASHMEHAYDFYKPSLDSEYPTVFGHESNECYLRALDNCYQRYAHKYEQTLGDSFSLDAVDHVIFHSPYNKLVKKSGARMLLNDFHRYPSLPVFHQGEAAEKHRPALHSTRSKSLQSTFTDREVEKTFVDLARPMYEGMIEPSTLLPRELGNSYTASCYTGLLSLISSWHSASSEDGSGGEESTATSSSFSADNGHAWFDHEAAADHSVGTGPPLGTQTLVFSYGSGLASTLFSLTTAGDTSKIAELADLDNRLAARDFRSAAEFTETLERREKRYNTTGFVPEGDPETDLWPGTYYLAENDEHGRRRYERTQLAPIVPARAAAAEPALRSARAFSTFAMSARRVLRR